jgi:hypothetical protein
MSIIITQARNGRYIDQAGNFDVEINHPEYGWIDYTWSYSDTDTTVCNESIKKAIGEDIAAFVPPTQEELDALEAEEARNIRNSLLAENVDPIVSNPLRWNSLTEAKQQEWVDYRQALLELPDNTPNWPYNIIWPTIPQ